MTDHISAQKGKAKPFTWAALFIAAMAASAVIAMFELLPSPWPFLLMMASLIFMIPMVNAARRKQRDSGMVSAALTIYNRRMMITSAVYAAAFLSATKISKSLAEGSALMWIVAAASILPVLGMIWVMMRYIQDETDEYLRHKTIMAALAGLGAVLAFGTVSGFLAMFDLVPNIWSWWVLPVWAVTMGIAQCGPKRWFKRNSQGDAS